MPRIKRQEKKADTFTPDYRFYSRKRAEQEAQFRCKDLGMDPRVLVAVGPNKEGMYAIATCAAAPMFGGAKVSRQFKLNDRVYNLCFTKRHGTVRSAGPEVSEVRWDSSPDRTEMVPNYYLDLITTRVKRKSNSSKMANALAAHAVERQQKSERVRRIRR